jgi:hypothetical protein
MLTFIFIKKVDLAYCIEGEKPEPHLHDVVPQLEFSVYRYLKKADCELCF